MTLQLRDCFTQTFDPFSESVGGLLHDGEDTSPTPSIESLTKIPRFLEREWG